MIFQINILLTSFLFYIVSRVIHARDALVNGEEPPILQINFSL